MRNGKANITRHKSSVASTTGERNQATQKMNQHGDDQDRTSVDCQDVGFAFAQGGHNAQFWTKLLRGLTASYNPHFDQAHFWGDNREQHP